MRIVVFTKAFWPDIGGVETYVSLLAEGLCRVKQDNREAPSVCVVTWSPERGKPLTRPFQVIRRPSLGSLWKIIRDADVVHLAGPLLIPLLIASILRKPLFVEQHGYQARCVNGLLLLDREKVCPEHFRHGRYWKCIACNARSRGFLSSTWAIPLTLARRLLCCRATGNIAITDHVRRRLGLPRSTVVYYGLPERDPESVSVSGGDTKPPVFAYVGRLAGEKGLPLLLDAATELRAEGHDFQIRFIGDGDQRAALEEGVRDREIGEVVKFTGFLVGRDLADCLSEVDAVVMPSIWEETAGLAAMEQMMRGRLVIAADIGGLGEVVGDAGLKFQPGKSSALAARMREVIERPQVVREVGGKARRRAMTLFRQERMVEEHIRLYESAFAAKDRT